MQPSNLVVDSSALYEFTALLILVQKTLECSHKIKPIVRFGENAFLALLFWFTISSTHPVLIQLYDRYQGNS